MTDRTIPGRFNQFYMRRPDCGCNHEQRGLAVEAIASMDAAYVIDTFNVQRLSMCGVATAILFACSRGAAAARVLAISDSVEVAVQWRGHVPLGSFGNVVSPWNLLCEVDPQNPVGFA